MNKVVFYENIALLEFVVFEQVCDKLIGRQAILEELECLTSPPLGAHAENGEEQSRRSEDSAHEASCVLLFEHSPTHLHPQGSVIRKRAHLQQISDLYVYLF